VVVAVADVVVDSTAFLPFLLLFLDLLLVLALVPLVPLVPLDTAAARRGVLSIRIANICASQDPVDLMNALSLRRYTGFIGPMGPMFPDPDPESDPEAEAPAMYLNLSLLSPLTR